MTLEEFLAAKPTQEEAIKTIRSVANNNVLPIDDTFVWGCSSEYTGIAVDDLWGDQKETIEIFGEEEVIAHYGIYNWKLKEDK